jgi:uncharacterized protein (TIGR03437 family)
MKIRPVVFLSTLGAALSLNAAPKLRLTQTAVGPIIIAQGSNGPTFLPSQTLYAYNAGDGALNLTVTSSDTWLAPTLGTPTLCQSGQGCIPIRTALPTSGLAKGTYTGFITLSDPNAQDAPQTISVIVKIGGDVPDQISLYAPPGGGNSAPTFYTGINSITRISTQSGGNNWLSVASVNLGSFQFSTPYTVSVAAGTLAEGDYSGNVAIQGSPFQPDNKSIGVTMHVTTQPIAQPFFPGTISFSIAQGAVKQYFPVQTAGVFYPLVTNGGQGTLTYTGTPTAASTGGNWLTIAVSPNDKSLFQITADPTGLSPGTYQGTVSIPTNAVNGPTTIPVQLSVLAAGPPFAKTGIANGFTSSTDDGLAQGDFVALFGNQFTNGDPQTGALPLGTNLGGTQVLINGTPVPIQYVSATQINIQIPYNAAIGDGTLSVVRNGTQGNTVSLHINAVAPAVLAFGGGYVVAQTGTGGFEGYAPSVPAHAGDVLVLYAVGLGGTNPAVTAGTAAPASPLATVPNVKVCIGSLTPVNPNVQCFDPQFAGLTPGFFGLYQINFAVPQNPPKGDAVEFYVTVGQVRSNVLSIAIQ